MTLYTLYLHNVMYQLYLNKAQGGKREREKERPEF